jgi:hypothetical protein
LRRSYSGSFDVDFALRYEPSDQSIRAHELRVHSFRPPGLPPQTLKLLDAYGQALRSRRCSKSSCTACARATSLVGRDGLAAGRYYGDA